MSKVSTVFLDRLRERGEYLFLVSVRREVEGRESWEQISPVRAVSMQEVAQKLKLPFDDIRLDSKAKIEKIETN